MMLVNQNLRFLRHQKGWTQKELAEKLNIKPAVIGAYEEERATPPLPCLLDVVALFGLSLDVFVGRDLSKIPEKEWKEGQYGRGKDVLAITVDDQGRENVELVTQKASAGYLNGHQDPEYIRELPRINFPVLSRNATYRAFEIRGDSMLPIPSGSIVFGEYVDDLSTLKNGTCHILVTKGEGIVFKRLFNFIAEKGCFLLVSDNRQYAPYMVEACEVMEVWKAKGYYTTHFEGIGEDGGVRADHLAREVLTLQEEIKKLRKAMP